MTVKKKTEREKERQSEKETERKRKSRALKKPKSFEERVFNMLCCEKRFPREKCGQSCCLDEIQKCRNEGNDLFDFCMVTTLTEFFSGKLPLQHKHVEHSFFARTYSGIFGPRGARWASWRGERDRETVRRCFVRWILIVAVCGQEQGWLGPQPAAKEVGQGARVELHSVRREQLPRQSPSQRLQRTRWEAIAKTKSSGQRQAQQRQRHGSVVGPRSHQRYTAREDKSRHTRITSSSRKDDRGNGRQRKHDRSTQHSWKKDAETLQRSTTDNRSVALQIEST